jgi:hypothetical protein
MLALIVVGLAVPAAGSAKQLECRAAVAPISGYPNSP